MNFCTSREARTTVSSRDGRDGYVDRTNDVDAVGTVDADSSVNVQVVVFQVGAGPRFGVDIVTRLRCDLGGVLAKTTREHAGRKEQYDQKGSEVHENTGGEGCIESIGP